MNTELSTVTFEDGKEPSEQTGQTGQFVGREGDVPPDKPKRRTRGASEPFFEVAWSKTEGKWRFGLWAANGRLLMTSANAYERKKDAIVAIHSVAKAAPAARNIIEASDTPETPETE